jgi:hypothetical protein
MSTYESQHTTQQGPSAAAKPQQGGESHIQSKYDPTVAAGHMSADQLNLLLPSYNISRFNEDVVTEEHTETTNDVIKAHGIRVAVIQPVASSSTAASKIQQVPNKLRTDKDIVLSADFMIYGLDYPGQLWLQGSDAMEGKAAPVSTDLLFMTVTHNPPAAAGTANLDRNSLLLCYSAHSQRPLFVIERPIKDHFKFLKVYGNNFNYIGRVEVSTRFLKKKIQIVSHEDAVLYTLKTSKLLGSSELFISEGKKKVGLISKRFTEILTKEGPVGFDCFFPSAASWEQRCLFMAATLYMDNLWFDKGWLSNIGV